MIISKVYCDICQTEINKYTKLLLNNMVRSRASEIEKLKEMHICHNCEKKEIGTLLYRIESEFKSLYL